MTKIQELDDVGDVGWAPCSHPWWATRTGVHYCATCDISWAPGADLPFYSKHVKALYTRSPEWTAEQKVQKKRQARDLERQRRAREQERAWDLAEEGIYEEAQAIVITTTTTTAATAATRTATTSTTAVN